MGGGNNGKKTIFSAVGLSRADVLAIGRSRCNSDNGNQYPGIAVDINWAVYQLKKLAGGPLASICQLLLAWASKGAVMWPICDGDTRPVSKQATNKSNAKRKKGRNKATIARVELRKINETIRLGGLDEEALAKAMEQRTTLQKDIKSGESQSTKQVPNNFPQLLADNLAKLSAHELSESNGTVKEVLTAEFQADGLMGGLYEEGKVQLIMTGDIDIPIIFGDSCITITKCTGKTFNIASTCKKTLTDAISCLPLQRQQKIKFHDPQWPLYSGISDRRLRVLIMVIVESDVCPGGVYGAGPGWVQTTMNAISQSKSPKSVYEQLVDHAAAKDKRFTAELLNTYVDAVVFEPVNEYGGQRKYMDGNPPANLPSYLEEFQTDSTEIDAGPSVLECKGTGVDARHKFLEAVEHHSCTACKETTCKHCTDFIEKQPHCLECYLVKKILPGADVSNLTPIHQMSLDLIEKYNFNKEDVDKLLADEVEKIWKDQSLQRSLEEMAEKVEFPLLPSSAIHSTDGDLKTIAEVDLGFGAAFVHNPDIPPKTLPPLLELLAALVLFDKPGKKYTTWQKDGSVFSAMPKMFIDFAMKCRIDIGYRLLERCVRHAMDNRTAPLDANEKHLMRLVMYKGKVGIAINAPIPASMKGDVYDGWTVITIDSLLCAECDCKSGSKEDDKVACVHTLARAYLLSILLCEDLAEHILVELCSYVSSGDVERNVWNDDEIASMKKSMIVLAEATGNMELSDAMSKQTTIHAMLESFQTGTQKSNEWKRACGKPSPDEILPLTEMNLDSSVFKAKLKMHRATPKKSNEPTEPIRTFDPDYSGVCAACNAVGISPSKIPYVGHQLLVHRRNELHEDADVQAAKMLEMQPKWTSLMEEAESRSKRVADTSLFNLRQPRECTTTPLRRSGRISSNTEEDERPKKKRKFKAPGYKCCAKLGCPNHSQMEGITMHRIPPMPTPLGSNGKKPTKEQIIKWRKKAEIHWEFMDRCGYGRDDTIKADLRICSAHETVKHTTRQITYTHSGITISERFSFDVISGAGESSSLLPSMATKGVASTRAVSRILSDVQEKAKKAPSPVTVTPTTENKLQRERRLREEAEGTAAETVMVMQQVVECNSIEESPVPINPVVARIAGIVTPTPKVPPRKRKFSSNDTSTGALDKSREKLTRTADLPPSVLPNIKASEVKRRTGFENVSAMLAYIVVVTNGNFDLIRERRSSLTWFEEWFRYFEWCYGEVCRRQIDRESEWGIGTRQIRAVIDLKAAIEVGALQSWPRFASFSEDKALRDSAKWNKYDNDRIILWDMTNVTMPQSSDAGVQRTTYSQYYSENCLKAGVGIQLCGWLLVWDLWGGGITDDQYNNKSGYLQEQETFAKTDLVDGKVMPFTNVKDRGYRTSFAAWKHGEQKVLQPPFAKSDKRFNGRQTIYAGSIARDRSGNERGVNVSKRSGMFQRGFQKTMSQKRFNYAWLTWSFKANFMYKRVL